MTDIYKTPIKSYNTFLVFEKYSRPKAKNIVETIELKRDRLYNYGN